MPTRDIFLNKYQTCNNFLSHHKTTICAQLPCIEVCNVLDPGIVLSLGEAVERRNLLFPLVVLPLGEGVQVGDLLLPRVVLALGPVVQGGDLLLAGGVLRVELALQFGDVSDAGLIKVDVYMKEVYGFLSFLSSVIPLTSPSPKKSFFFTYFFQLVAFR